MRRQNATFFCLFDTVIGHCGLSWRGKAAVNLQLPEDSLVKTRQRLRAQLSDVSPEELNVAQSPAWVQKAVASLQKHLETGDEDLSKIPVDLSTVPTFHRLVYEAAMKIPSGVTITYGQLAERIGSPGAARAVGQALGRNPLALIVPCHRIVAANGKSGGFSAWGGVHTKQVILSVESKDEFFGESDFWRVIERSL